MVPKNLKRWTLPRDYMGAHWDDYYVFLGKHRDSDSITRSNFTVGLDRLGGESETVMVVRESHWAVGWVEWIAIHESDLDAIAKADAMAGKITDYPVLNEEHWSDLELSEACDYWASLSVRERIELCQEHGLSVFAARHDYLPQDDNGSLLDALRSY